MKKELVDFIIARLKRKFVDKVEDKSGGIGHNFFSQFGQYYEYKSLDRLYYAMELLVEYGDFEWAYDYEKLMEWLGELKKGEVQPSYMHANRNLLWNLYEGFRGLKKAKK